MVSIALLIAVTSVVNLVKGRGLAVSAIRLSTTVSKRFKVHLFSKPRARLMGILQANVVCIKARLLHTLSFSFTQRKSIQ